MSCLRKVILNLLPYGVVVKIVNKRYPRRGVIHYDRNLPDIKETTSKFYHIVSVQGFGFSGSGAVVDFLREFPCCLTFGSVDIEGSKVKRAKLKNGEIDFLRLSGGLFEMEHYLDDNNLFIKDALIKRFKRLVYDAEIFQEETTRMLANQFYNQLIEFEIDTKGNNDYNGHLSDMFKPDANIKVMRRMSLSEYRNLCKRFLTSIFNELHEANSKYLVLDQLCSDFNFDNSRNREYIPNLKTILVYRDPRDIYSYALLKDVPWIPHDDVDVFIKWYRLQWDRVNRDSSDILIIRFEDLVNCYENKTAEIMRYLNLDSDQHVLKFECFDPIESAKNIAIWKNLVDDADSMERIANQLQDYCYKS